MSTDKKQKWDIRSMINASSAHGVFMISGILVILAILAFYILNERRQKQAADQLLALTTQRETLFRINQDIKDKIQYAFNNYLLFNDYQRETQRIEALVSTGSAGLLVEQYKTMVSENFGSELAAEEFTQLSELFASFETELRGQLDKEGDPIEEVPTTFEESAEEEAILEDAGIDTAMAEPIEENDFAESPEIQISTAITANAVVIDKKSALVRQRELNNQLFIIDNTVALHIEELIAEQNQQKSYWHYLVFSLIIFILLIATWLTINRIQKKTINEISNDLMHIAKGERPELQSKDSDSFSTITTASNELVSYLDDASRFAKKIGEGDFEYSFNPKSNNDELGNSLIEMRNRLQEVAREDKIRNWTNEGQAKFGELLRLHSDDLETLGSQVLSNLVDYLNASQGALFVLSEEGETHLELLAAYANKRKKFITRQILPGEGLAGQVFQEGKSVYITDIRTDHFNIETGLGESKPSSLLIVPLKEENKIEGVIEIASLNKLQKHEIAFVEAIGKNIASSFNSGKINETTKRLLEETQEKAEQMKAQEEELRQNMEELAATQEQMERRNREMEEIQQQLSQERSLLLALLKESKDHIYFKDRDSKFIRVSQSMVELFKVKDESEIIGKSDFDFGFGEHAKVAFEDEQRIIRTGKPMEDVIEAETWDDGHITYVSTTKNPLRDLNGQIVGTFGISRDVTHTKQDEISLKKNKEWLLNYFHFNPAGFVVLNQKGSVEFASEKLLNVTKKKSEIIFEDIFAGITFEEFLTAISFQEIKDQPVETELLLHNKTRTPIECVAVASGQTNEDGSANIFIIQK